MYMFVASPRGVAANLQFWANAHTCFLRERFLLAIVCWREMRDYCFASGLRNSTRINATYKA